MNLPKLIQSSDGFTLTRVMREEGVAIYRRSKRIGKAVIEHFEVIMVIPGDPDYPESEAWGLRGWTCRDLEEAWERVAKIRDVPPLGRDGFEVASKRLRLEDERAWMD